MNTYQILIPQGTLILGVMVLALFQTVDIQFNYRQGWIIHTIALALAFTQQLILYRMPASLFARGGMILDGTTQVFSLCILFLSLLIQINRYEERYSASSQTTLLSLGVTFFSLFVIQANRVFFGVLGILGMIWLAQAALASENKQMEQTKLIYSSIVRGLLFLVVGAILCILCLNVFGESQMDEIQRVIVRGHVRAISVLAIEIFVLFFGAAILGVPPFGGVLGRTRREASWSLSLGITGLFAIVGLAIFVRWGILMLTRPAIGGLELEPLTSLNVLEVVRLLASIGLILTPLLAILNSNLRGSILFFILNPFVQALFALSFGQKEVLGAAIGQVMVAVVVIGVLISSIQALDLSPKASLREWMSLGRKDMMAALTIILSLSSAAGLAPFYGSILLQKTLSINSPYSSFLLFNIVLSGFYVGRLLTLTFHKDVPGAHQANTTQAQRFWFATQFILLIFMGIFWQPLYKYGAFSIRQFFGEV